MVKNFYVDDKMSQPLIEDQYIHLGSNGLRQVKKDAQYEIAPMFTRNKKTQPDSYLKRIFKSASGKSIKRTLIAIVVLCGLLVGLLLVYFVHRRL